VEGYLSSRDRTVLDAPPQDRGRMVIIPDAILGEDSSPYPADEADEEELRVYCCANINT